MPCLTMHPRCTDATAFVLELAEGGEVFESICKHGAYSESAAAAVVRQVALALAFMHSVGVVHRDLKVRIRARLKVRAKVRLSARVTPRPCPQAHPHPQPDNLQLSNELDGLI